MTDLCVGCGRAVKTEDDPVLPLCPQCSGASLCREAPGVVTHVIGWRDPARCLRCDQPVNPKG